MIKSKHPALVSLLDSKMELVLSKLSEEEMRIIYRVKFGGVSADTLESTKVRKKLKSLSFTELSEISERHIKK